MLNFGLLICKMSQDNAYLKGLFGRLNKVTFEKLFGTAVKKIVFTAIPDNYSCEETEGICVVSCIR